jgi:arabinofuranan 3-O-arabinosyltransferase
MIVLRASPHDDVRPVPRGARPAGADAVPAGLPTQAAGGDRTDDHAADRTDHRTADDAPAASAAIAARVLWPAAAAALLHTGVGAATGPARDLHILWSAGGRLRAGEGLYDAEHAFIYPPIAGWALAPLSALPFRVACVVMTVLSLASLVAAVVLLLRLVGVRWTSPATPAVLLALALARPVVGLLDQGNVDVLLVLAEAVVVHALVTRRDGRAAVVLGVVCAVKPTLAPLLLGAVLLGRGGVALRAAAVAAVLTLVGLVAVPDARVFVADVLPLLADGNRAVLHPYDRSLRGAVDALDLPTALGAVARAGAMLVAVAIAWQRRHGPLAALEVMPVLVLGALLASSFSWANYSLYLLPLLVGVALAGSLVRAWPAWVAVYALWSERAWPTPPDPGTVDVLVALRPTWGWGLLLATCAWVAWRSRGSSGRGTVAA